MKMPFLHAFAQNLWVYDFPMAPLKVELGARSTIVKLSNGKLWVHSPGPLSPALKAELGSLGEVGALVAPNTMHHMFLPDWHAAYPEVPVYGPEELEPKRPDVPLQRFQHDMWPGDFEMHGVRGIPRLREIVFYHIPSGTLILTDLAFNVHRPKGRWTNVFLFLNGALNRFGPSFLMKMIVVQDQEQFRDSIQRILKWSFDRIVLAHGRNVESDGQRVFRQGFAYLKL